ncbi:MAG: hypothetical protein LLG04_00155 [Parachlamydia sp.]|nr:hypothetical protein [Parachlamydia sp.]
MQPNQLLIAISPKWNAVQGNLALYEQSGSSWINGGFFPVMFGKNGMAWGIGLHPPQQGIQKLEGDGKSPAGIFALGPAFGHARAIPLNMDYLALTSSLEAVDDPQSIHYNQIVNRDQIAHPDWKSSEKMAEISVYDLGVVVHHNYPQAQRGAGSAIFMHIWTNAQTGTAGCTAMERENLALLLAWLDKMKNPLLVQLPIEEYERLQEAWGLPETLIVTQRASTTSQNLFNSSSVL